MIISNLPQWKQEKGFYPKVFATALNFILEHDVINFERTTHLIAGNDIFVNIIEDQTKNLEQLRFEVHYEYIDIHIVLAGKERHYYELSSPLEESQEDRKAKDDVAFYGIHEGASTIVLLPGEFAVYFPGEQHAPMGAVEFPQSMIKAVVKIHRRILL